MIYIDWDPQAFQLNPENVLRVPKWEGNMDDTTLARFSHTFIHFLNPKKEKRNKIEKKQIHMGKKTEHKYIC